MWFAELAVALLVALAAVALFSLAFRRPGPWGGFFWFFLVVFLGAWAVGAWAEPVGPVVYDVAWVPILIGGLILALVIAAVPVEPSRRTPPPATTTPEEVETAAAVGTIGLFFWFLILAFLVVLVFAYI